MPEPSPGNRHDLHIEPAGVALHAVDAAPDDGAWSLEDLPISALRVTRTHGVVDVNRAWIDLTGLDLRASGAAGWLGAVHRDDRTLALALAQPEVPTSEPPPVELRLVPQGSRRSIWVEGRCRPTLEGRPSIVILAVIDAYKRRASSLDAKSKRDPLTGLLRRDIFITRCREELAGSSDAPTAVLFIDLDGFKLVNDLHGHGVGDTVLRAAARRIRQTLRPQDLVGRLGGDELSALCFGIATQSDAEHVAERVVRSLAEPFSIGSGSVVIGASIGVDLSDGSMTARLRAADAAMYAAKAAGGGRVVVTSATGESIASAAEERFSTGLQLALRAVDRAADSIDHLWRLEFAAHDAALRDELANASHTLRGLTRRLGDSSTIS